MQNQQQEGGFQTQPQQQVFTIHTIQPPRPSGKVEQFNGKAAVIIGALMIGFGVLSVFLGGFAIGLFASYFFIGTGIWCGLLVSKVLLQFFVVTGSFGIAAAKLKSKCLIITFMVLSIVMASVACFLLLLFSSMGPISQDAMVLYNCRYGYYCTSETSRVVVNALLVLTFIVEAVLSITASAYCCKAVCCCNNIQVPNSTIQGLNVPTGYITRQDQSGAQVMTTSGQQLMLVSIPPNNAITLLPMEAQPGAHTVNIAPGYNATVPQAQDVDEAPPQYAEKQEL